MKLETNNNKCKIGDILSEKKFVIGNSALILEYLRSNIYKNPIQAITREVPCNARDTHREVGNTSPITITLPNEWDPNYSVQDHGFGMPPERVDIFVSFGDSTKRDSNNETGGFGLGCKSPFSYVDTFTITTIFDGVKYYYSAILDGGDGRTVLFKKEDTDEPNGTTITIPVAKKDFQAFIDQTLFATQFWDIKPILKGVSPQVEYPESEVSFSGTGWEIRTGYESAKHTFLTIDGIQYEIDNYEIDSLEYTEKKYFYIPFILKFKVGELDLAPSRDNLRYTDKTKKAIAASIVNAHKEVSAQVLDRINKAESFYDALLIYNNVKDFNQYLASSFNYVNWENHQLTDIINLNQIGIYATCNHFTDMYSFKVRKVNTIINVIRNTRILILFNDNNEKVKRASIELLINDPTNNYNEVCIISCPNKPTSRAYKDAVSREAFYNRTVNVSYNLDVINRYRIKKLSNFTLPTVPKSVSITAASNRGRQKAATGYIIGYSLDRTTYDNIKVKPIELKNDGGIYVFVDSSTKKISFNNKFVSYYHIKEFSEFIGKEIYGFSKTRINKLDPKWISLSDALQNKIDEVLKENPLNDLLNSEFDYEYHFDRHFQNIPFLSNSSYKLLDDSLMLEYIKKSNKNMELYKEMANIKQALVWLGSYSRKEKSTSDLLKLNEEVQKEYPMIKFAREHWNISTLDFENDILNYINLIDSQKTKTQTAKKIAS